MEKIHLVICDDEAYYIEDIQKLLNVYIEETGCEILADSKNLKQIQKVLWQCRIL